MDLVPVNSIAFPFPYKSRRSVLGALGTSEIFHLFLQPLPVGIQGMELEFRNQMRLGQKTMLDLCVKESRHECDSTYVLLSEPGGRIQKDHLHVNRSSHSHLLISSGKRSKQGSNLL